MVSLPVFFHEGVLSQGAQLWLAEDTARHVVQVLRMQQGQQLKLTDGKGNEAVCSIAEAGKKKCAVTINSVQYHEANAVVLHLAVAFTKNTARNEWLLEKATELGATSIIPLLAARTEREKTRHERWRNILISAMLQSQQYHLPDLPEPLTVEKMLASYNGVQQKLVAHCMDGKEKQPLTKAMLPGKETLILIGPEGDFTADEVNLCEVQGCVAISLGTQRLRTETAAMSVCAYFNSINNG